MFPKSLETKQNIIRSHFSACTSAEEKYKKIIEIGKLSPPLASEFKKDAYRVSGCQSTMYLRTYVMDLKVYFQAESDALISAGLAVLLTEVYSGETAETVLKSSPDYLKELMIPSSLSPSRANGLYSIYLRMKQDVLKLLVDGYIK